MSRGVHVKLERLTKLYRKAGQSIPVLSEVDLELEPGSRVAIVGPSGAGKSTFLHMVGLLDRPTSGTVRLNGQDTLTLSTHACDTTRNRLVGFVFQAHHLLPEHSALHNVAIPCRLAGATRAVAEARAQALLRVVGLEGRLHHRPGELSGGEQQRVAIARALVMGPGLVLADEPTGNLDPRTAGGVFDMLHALNVQLGSTLVVVTHSRELADQFPRRLLLEGGKFREV
jgi:lipoprotein-releasing system ATP-binding protein